MKRCGLQPIRFLSSDKQIQMAIPKSPVIFRCLHFLGVVLLLKVVATVLLAWQDYLPPNFQTEFLRGRQFYFFGAYQWAFYTHVITGPCSLVLGTILFSNRIRNRVPRLHRTIGHIQVFTVLLLVSPSGLWMAFYADSGFPAGSAFATLAIATAICIICGWRAAVHGQFVRHRTWMGRCFALLCSAIVLRMIGGIMEVIGVEASWVYPLSAWACWLIPLSIFEVFDRVKLRGQAGNHPLSPWSEAKSSINSFSGSKAPV